MSSTNKLKKLVAPLYIEEKQDGLVQKLFDIKGLGKPSQNKNKLKCIVFQIGLDPPGPPLKCKSVDQKIQNKSPAIFLVSTFILLVVLKSVT